MTSVGESIGNTTVRSDVQEVGFRSQNINVSNLVMPDEALLIASDSICSSTRSKYNSMFNRFVSYGRAMGTNVSFSQVLVNGFLLSIYSSKGSIGSILIARASIRFFWVLNFSLGLPSPTDSDFVQKFMKGLNFQKKTFKPPVKAYPLSYSELEQLYFGFVWVCMIQRDTRPFSWPINPG